MDTTHFPVDEISDLATTLESAVNNEGADIAVAARDLIQAVREFVTDVPAGAKLFTRDEVSIALNKAADLAADESNPDGMEWSRSIRDQDVINLVVNAAGEYLDNPEATFDDVAENYDADDDEIREWIS